MYCFYLTFTVHVCVVIVMVSLLLLAVSPRVFISKVIYTCLNVCPFDNAAFAGWDPVNRFNFTSWVAVATPIERQKSAIIV